MTKKKNDTLDTKEQVESKEETTKKTVIQKKKVKIQSLKGQTLTINEVSYFLQKDAIIEIDSKELSKINTKTIKVLKEE